ncbi:MAG: hypothetical protein QW718_02455 [Nitrososphaerota archaeon]
MRKTGQSNTLVITIAVAMVLGIGLFVWSILSAYASIYRVKALEELNAEALVLRSMISADYVIYPGGEAYIRNTGKEPVVIFRLITLRNGEIAWDSFQVYGIREIERIDVREVSKIFFDCPGCSRDDLVVLQVHYMPADLYDPSNPELINPTSDVMLFRVASFKAEELTIAPGNICPIPINEKWVWIDYVDPVEEGGTISNVLKIKLPRASILDEVLLHTVLEDRDGDIAEGERIVPTVSSGEELIELSSSSSLEYPVEIYFDVRTPNWTLIQNHWTFKNDVTAYVDKIMLIWSPYTFRLTGAFLTINYNDDGHYKIEVKVNDCNGVLIAKSEVIDREVRLGGFRELYLDYGLEFDRNPLMSDVYSIEVQVVDVSPIVTVTETSTVTKTATTTSTSLSTATVPETTITNTQTATSTRTVTSTTLFYATQTTTVPRTTITTTITTTRTVTRTSYTATATVTTTRTSTSIVTTVSTVSRTSTITIPASTRTITTTVTTTRPTTITTQTLTSTVTSYTTVTTITKSTTSTVYSTKTVTTSTTTTTMMQTCPLGSPIIQSSDIKQSLFSLGVFLPFIYVVGRRWKSG